MPGRGAGFNAAPIEQLIQGFDLDEIVAEAGSLD